MKTKIFIIGLGNILLRDEGAGVHAVEEMRKRYDFPPDVRLLDGGTLGLDLLPLIEGVEKILFIDAVDLKEKPGAIALIEDADLPSFLEPKLSLHHVGLSDLLFASSFLGNRPAKIALVGIQPETLEVGLDLSEKVMENFEKLLQTIVAKLQEWGVEIKEKRAEGPVHVPGHSI